MLSPALHDYWLLQIVLQTLSKATQVPLRAARLSAAHAFRLALPDVGKEPRHVCDPDRGKHRVPVPTEDWLESATHYSHFSSQWEHIYNSLSPGLWLTDSYNAYPIVIAFSEHRAWRFLSLISIVDKLSQIAEGKGAIRSAAFFGDFHISLYPTQVQDIAIIAGPVWAPLDRYSGNYFHIHREQPTVAHFRRVMEAAGQDIKYDDYRLKRLAASRWPVEHHDLAQRMTVITTTIDSLANMICNEDVSMRQDDLVGLTEWAAFCAQLSTETADNELLDALSRTTFRIDHSSAARTKPESVFVTMGQYVPNATSGHHPDFSVSRHARLDSHGHSSPILLNGPDSLCKDTDACQLQNIRDRFSQFLGYLRVQDNAFKMESLFLIREWLADQIGVLTALSIVVQDDVKKVKEVSYKLARRTLQLMSADSATIYCYDYQQGVLDTYGIYCPWQKAWSTTRPPLMASVASSDTRPLSISYRAFDRSETRFCRAYDPTTQESDPPGEPLVPVPDGLGSGRCGIACPIAIFGRPWGVLEVIGARPYQFRWYDKTFMEEIASLLSPFYYNFFFLKHFHALNVVAVGERSMEDKYKAIARHLAGLFLSESAVLWVRKSSASGDLQLVSWCNRPDLDEMQQGSPAALDIRLKLNEATAITQQIIAQGAVWLQGTIGEAPLSRKWLDKPYTNRLESMGVRTAAFIPIRRESGESVASVTLFSKSPGRWNRDWEPLVIFVRRYLAVLLDAVHTRVDWERQARNTITHNLREYVCVMQASSQKIASCVESIVKRDGSASLHPEFKNWIWDMETARDDCEREIQALSSERLEAVERTGGDPQIELVRRALEEEPTRWIEFKEQFNRVFRPDLRRHGGRRLTVSYVGEDRGLFIRMHPFSLRDVLSALYSNAVKYAVADTSILAYLKVSYYGVYFTVKNLGEPLEEGEEYRIFRRGYRGAKSGKVEGQGLGLYVARGICELYGLSLDYRKSVPHGDAYVWHEFTVTFPKRCCKGV